MNRVIFSSTSALSLDDYRKTGASVRCIKNLLAVGGRWIQGSIATDL
jgi:hypothetical protein